MKPEDMTEKQFYDSVNDAVLNDEYPVYPAVGDVGILSLDTEILKGKKPHNSVVFLSEAIDEVGGERLLIFTVLLNERNYEVYCSLQKNPEAELREWDWEHTLKNLRVPEISAVRITEHGIGSSILPVPFDGVLLISLPE